MKFQLFAISFSVALGMNANAQVAGKSSVWSAEKCKAELPSIIKVADNCMKIKSEDKRRLCFGKIEKNSPKGFAERCSSLVEAKITEYIIKEKTLYPNQGSAFKDDEVPSK